MLHITFKYIHFHNMLKQLQNRKTRSNLKKIYKVTFKFLVRKRFVNINSEKYKEEN